MVNSFDDFVKLAIQAHREVDEDRERVRALLSVIHHLPREAFTDDDVIEAYDRLLKIGLRAFDRRKHAFKRKGGEKTK